MNSFLLKLKNTIKGEPLYRVYRDKGDELNKQKNYEEALELYIRSYKYSLKENDSSLMILMRIVKIADKKGNNQITEKWINEFDNIKNTENNPEYALFGKVKILISINRISDAIIELNKMYQNKMSYYDFHLKHKYYQICYKKLKLIKTQLHHCIIKRIFFLAHHYDLSDMFKKRKESLNQRYKALTGKDSKFALVEDKKDEYRGSIFLADDQDKEMINLFKRGKFTTGYNQFKEDVDKILVKESHILEKVENMSTQEFNEYFKLIN